MRCEWPSCDRGRGTKTPKSRRVLSLPRLAVRALSDHLDRQGEDRSLAGALWQDHGLVFASAAGTLLDRHNVLREFRKITKAAGLGTDWVPREMRHTFVSLLSGQGSWPPIRVSPSCSAKSAKSLDVEGGKREIIDKAAGGYPGVVLRAGRPRRCARAWSWPHFSATASSYARTPTC